MNAQYIYLIYLLTLHYINNQINYRFIQEKQVFEVVIPNKQISSFQKKFNYLSINYLNYKPVKPYDQDHKILLLQQIDQDLQHYVETNNLQLFKDKSITLSYDNLTMSEILRQLIPKDLVKDQDIPSGFETVGTIAHVNIPKKLLEYKFIVGQVILDKNPLIQKVVNKIGQINNVFRFYDLECIGGEDQFEGYETIQTEDKVKFKVDVSKVYWCSKLSTERNRFMQNNIKPKQVLLDLFCGIGPLSIKCAKLKQCYVIANDLNPDCYKYLQANIELNKVKKLVYPLNMDARECLKYVVEMSKQENGPIPKEFLKFDHVYMNLPVDALEFLDGFIGIFNYGNQELWKEDMPLIHVYGFSNKNKLDEAKEDFIQRIRNAMKFQDFNINDIQEFHPIRDISNNQMMYSISFKLPVKVGYGKPADIYQEFENQDKKKQKLQ